MSQIITGNLTVDGTTLLNNNLTCLANGYFGSASQLVIFSGTSPINGNGGWGGISIGGRPRIGDWGNWLVIGEPNGTYGGGAIQITGSGQFNTGSTSNTNLTTFNIRNTLDDGFGNLTTSGSLTIGGNYNLFENDIECHGFYGTSSDPARGTGGGAILIGHGFTSATDNPQINLTDTIGGGSGATAQLVVDNGAITGVAVTNQGSGYSFADVTITNTVGAGARLSPVISGPITSIVVVTGFGGSQYNVGDTISIITEPGNQGAGAAAHVSAISSTGAITNVSVDSGGFSYVPGLTGASVNSSTGAGAQLQVVIDGQITGIDLVSNYGGAGYTANDTVTITNNPHNTLYLQQSIPGAVSQANLDLGNLTAHGSVTADGTLTLSGVPMMYFEECPGDYLVKGLRGGPTLTNDTMTRIWLEIDNASLIEGSAGSGASIQLADNATNYWEIINNPSCAASYIPASDSLCFYYDGTNPGSRFNIYGNGAVTTKNNTLDDGSGNTTCVGNLTAKSFDINTTSSDPVGLFNGNNMRLIMGKNTYDMEFDTYNTSFFSPRLLIKGNAVQGSAGIISYEPITAPSITVSGSLTIAGYNAITTATQYISSVGSNMQVSGQQLNLTNNVPLINSVNAFTANQTISKSTPQLILQGTETGGMTYTIEENAGNFEILYASLPIFTFSPAGNITILQCSGNIILSATGYVQTQNNFIDDGSGNMNCINNFYLYGNLVNQNTSQTLGSTTAYFASIYGGNLYSIKKPAITTTNTALYFSSTGEIGYASSSIRYKEKISTIDDCSWIYDLRPVNFAYKNDPENRSRMGLIAEEVYHVSPQQVFFNSDGQIEGIYDQYLPVALLVEMKKLRSKNDRLENDLAKLQEVFDELQSTVAQKQPGGGVKSD